MNAVMVCPNQRTGFVQHNLYVIDVDRNNRNCYNCGGFRHLARSCRNRDTGGRIGKERRLEYRNGNNEQKERIEGGNKNNSNLKRNQDLMLLN